jgi:hypothetical protein
VTTSAVLKRLKERRKVDDGFCVGISFPFFSSIEGINLSGITELEEIDLALKLPTS